MTASHNLKKSARRCSGRTIRLLELCKAFGVQTENTNSQSDCGYDQIRLYELTLPCQSLQVRRLSQGQIGVISALICVFCHRSLGGFSIVSVQPCLLFSDSGSKLGQYGILIFFRKPSIFVVVSSDASVNNPSSVSSGVSKTDLMLTATLAQDAMTVLDSALY